jgi:hypothetical protein
MNEQERGMIEGLFQRLQQAETQSGPRDQEAEALIRDLMARQPSAPYLLAQVVIVQEQGLRNLQTRVEELESQQAERSQGNSGFLGGLFGGGSQPQPQADAQPAARKSSGWSNNSASTRGTAAMQRPGVGQAGQGGGFMAGAMQTAMGIGGGILLANAVTGLFSEDAEAAEPEAAAPEALDEPDVHMDEEDDFFGDDGGDEF